MERGSTVILTAGLQYTDTQAQSAYMQSTDWLQADSEVTDQFVSHSALKYNVIIFTGVVYHMRHRPTNTSLPLEKNPNYKTTTKNTVGWVSGCLSVNVILNNMGFTSCRSMCVCVCVLLHDNNNKLSFPLSHAIIDIIYFTSETEFTKQNIKICYSFIRKKIYRCKKKISSIILRT